MPTAGGAEQNIFIDGPAGRIEARVMGMDALLAGDSGGALALVCHPHSLHGGSLQNKVVHTLCRAFRELGIPSIRFNFRGVGRSEGEYDAGIGETGDLLAVLEWAAQQAPVRQVWLAGFSFGAFVAARGARSLLDAGQPLAGLVLIAPSVENFPMQGLLPVPVPTLLAWGEADEVVDPQAIADWSAELDPPPTILRFPGVGHFFHGALPELKNGLVAGLQGPGA